MTITSRHISIAQKIAERSDVVKARMSAIAISRGGEIICFSNNRLLIGNRIRFSEHCEEAVIRKLQRLNAFNRFRDISIFVFRISSRGVSMAKPCLKCQRLLSKYDVKVLFTDDKGQIKEL